MRFDCSENKTDYVIDHFKTTGPLSTFAFGFIISQLTKVNATPTDLPKPKINVWVITCGKRVQFSLK